MTQQDLEVVLLELMASISAIEEILVSKRITTNEQLDQMLEEARARITSSPILSLIKGG